MYLYVNEAYIIRLLLRIAYLTFGLIYQLLQILKGILELPKTVWSNCFFQIYYDLGPCVHKMALMYVSTEALK